MIHYYITAYLGVGLLFTVLAFYDEAETTSTASQLFGYLVLTTLWPVVVSGLVLREILRPEDK